MDGPWVRIMSLLLAVITSLDSGVTGTWALEAGLSWTLAMQINHFFMTLLGLSEANTRAADCMTEFACARRGTSSQTKP